MTDDSDLIARAILDLTAARGAARSICPSEVARSLAEDWRPLLGAVRREAVRLAQRGAIEVLRHGKPIEPEAWRGVVRLRLREPAGDA